VWPAFPGGVLASVERQTNPSSASGHISVWQSAAENSNNYNELGLRRPGALPTVDSVKYSLYSENVCSSTHYRYCLFVEFNEMDSNPNGELKMGF
jgi:hypothetical protein